MRPTIQKQIAGPRRPECRHRRTASPRGRSTASSTLRPAVLDQLGEKSRLVQIAFITVDPERDTPEVLQDYMSSFGPNFVGLTGAPYAIRQVAKAFKVFFQKVPLPGGDYTMDHSVAIYILDKHARVRLIFTMNRQLEDVAHDILKLLREAS